MQGNVPIASAGPCPFETPATLATLSAEQRRTNEPLTSLEQARRIAGLAEEKLAQDIVILDMRPVCAYTDYFVVCSGQNSRQTKSIVDEVRYGLKHGEERVLPAHRRGRARGQLDRRRLPRRRPARLHARDARLLPARGALGRRALRRTRHGELRLRAGKGAPGGLVRGLDDRHGLEASDRSLATRPIQRSTTPGGRWLAQLEVTAGELVVHRSCRALLEVPAGSMTARSAARS